MFDSLFAWHLTNSQSHLFVALRHIILSKVGPCSRSCYSKTFLLEIPQANRTFTHWATSVLIGSWAPSYHRSVAHAKQWLLRVTQLPGFWAPSRKSITSSSSVWLAVFRITLTSRSTFAWATLSSRTSIRIACSTGEFAGIPPCSSVLIELLTFRNAANEKPSIYVYSTGEDRRTYQPVNSCLQDIAKSLAAVAESKKPWEGYLAEGLQHLQARTENDFTRPAANTDKLYMNIGNRDVIEVQHPVSSETTEGPATTRLHLGPIGSGKEIVRSDTSRIEFAREHGLLATDVEMGSVLDSIRGNCRDSFILVKGEFASFEVSPRKSLTFLPPSLLTGISDYKDGTTTKKWQNHASLAAAAVMKSIICAMDAPTNVWATSITALTNNV